MKKAALFIFIVYFVFPVSGSLYGVGEKTIALGGDSAWDLAEVRSGINEVNLVRSRPVLVLASAVNSGHVMRHQTAAAVDLSLSFDEGNAGLFRDSAGHYRLIAAPETIPLPPLVEAVDQRYARAGTGAAHFTGATPLIIEPFDRNALFAPNKHIRDFTLEFWLYPLSMENGEQILSWAASRPQRNTADSRGYALQQIQCVTVRNRLQWTFLNFFASADGRNHLDISISGDTPVVPKTWSHHLIRFDSSTGLLEYMVNGRTEIIDYASSTGREGGEVYTPITGEGGFFTLGNSFTGLMDEFNIHSAWLHTSQIQKYAVQGGRMETGAIDLGEGSNGVLRVEALGGRTSIAGARISNEFRHNGRFRFSDDSEMQFFIRVADNPYRWDDLGWHTFNPGADLAGNIRGRYVQLAVDFYPSANGEASPYLEELKIIYMPDEPPLPPVSLVAVAFDGGVELRWRNSPDADTAGYLVYYGTVQDDYFGEGASLGSSPVDAGKRNTIIIDGLKNGTLYYFRVAAYKRNSSLLTGEFSREARARPLQGLSAE
ncbi:MAG: hypothetical protein LBH97_06905 [Treponema sp.]|jgi:hypothetical protein|nr:hypothetical protein [Treponema sp.]